MIDLFEDLNILVSGEIEECNKKIKRKRANQLYTEGVIKGFKKSQTEAVSTIEVHRPLKNIDIDSGDAVMLHESSYIPSVEDIENSDKLRLKVGVLRDQKGRDCSIVFRKDSTLNNHKYYLSKADDAATVIMQKRAVEFVKERENWISNLLLNEYEVSGPIVSDSEISDLNTSQSEAFSKCVGASKSSNRFHMIWGPPGTGKTKTIAKIIEQVAKSGKRILLTSHTNVAIDNALEKVLSDFPELENKLLRIGNPEKIQKGIRKLLPEVRETNDDAEEPLVVGATLSKVANMTFAGEWEWENPKFDIVIMDESSMATIPLSLIGILHGKSFVLVGDHCQLPPIIQSEKTPGSGKKSLFEYLMNMYPNKCTLLDTQYRSNEGIISFSNENVYNNKIKTCKLNANLQLHISNVKGDFADIINPKNTVVWITHPGIHQWKKRKISNSWTAYNENEAAIALRLFEEFRKAGIAPKDIGIVTYCRLQADLIKRCLKEKYKMSDDEVANEVEDLEGEDYELLEAKTIDSYQGSERDLIIVSFVLDETGKHRALNDFRRLNVAMTRAKKKVIFIGSGSMGKNPSDWPHLANPYNLYDYIEKLQREAIGENHGAIISVGEERVSEELELSKKLARELCEDSMDTCFGERYSPEDERIIQLKRKILAEMDIL
jgi:superfamily I DNA and/or RNA helicase